MRAFPPVSVSTPGQEWFYVLDKISGEVALDIGAHAGDYSLRLSKRFVRVIAFEPDPTNKYCLETNLRVNKVENVTVDPRAVSGTVGKAVLRRSSKVPSGSTLSSRHYDWVEFDSSIEVDTVSLDVWSAANEHLPVSFVKIDAENHEFAVLKGADTLLTKQKPLVGLEVHGPTEGLNECICRSCSLLRSYDYVLETRKPSPGADAHWSLGRPA
jgi:FkbM family methyltransferase